LQLPFAPGKKPGVGSYPGQHRLLFFFPPAADFFAPFVAGIALSCE
jgi:hypothetical protein